MPTVIESIRRFPSLAAALDELSAPPANLVGWLRRQELEADSARVYAAQFLRSLWNAADEHVDITAAWTQWDATHRAAAVGLLNEVCPAVAPLPSADDAGLRCCHVGVDDAQCQTPPTHGIYSDDGGDPYRGSHACTEHVGELLYEGRNVVTPIEAELAR